MILRALVKLVNIWKEYSQDKKARELIMLQQTIFLQSFCESISFKKLPTLNTKFNLQK